MVTSRVPRSEPSFVDFPSHVDRSVIDSLASLVLEHAPAPDMKIPTRYERFERYAPVFGRPIPTVAPVEWSSYRELAHETASWLADSLSEISSLTPNEYHGIASILRYDLGTGESFRLPDHREQVKLERILAIRDRGIDDSLIERVPEGYRTRVARGFAHDRGMPFDLAELTVPLAANTKYVASAVSSDPKWSGAYLLMLEKLHRDPGHDDVKDARLVWAAVRQAVPRRNVHGIPADETHRISEFCRLAPSELRRQLVAYTGIDGPISALPPR